MDLSVPWRIEPVKVCQLSSSETIIKLLSRLNFGSHSSESALPFFLQRTVIQEFFRHNKPLWLDTERQAASVYLNAK